MLHLDRQHTGPDLDGVDLVKGDGEDGQQIGVIGSWAIQTLRKPSSRSAVRFLTTASTGEPPFVSLSNPTRLRLICMHTIEALGAEK
jgi:hypothetical protein